MARFPSFRYQVIMPALAIGMVGTLLIYLADFWHMHWSPWLLLTMATVAVAFAWLQWRQPRLAVVLVLSAMTLLVLGYYRLPRLALCITAVLQDTLELGLTLSRLELNTSFGPALGPVLLMGTALIAALLIVGEVLVRGSTLGSIACGTIVFATEWAWRYQPAFRGLVVYTVLALILWVVSYAAVRDTSWRGTQRRVVSWSHVKIPVVWALTTALVALILPLQFQAAALSHWQQKLLDLIPVLQHLPGSAASGERFSLKTTGFAPVMGSLGGEVRLDHTVALYVTTNTRLAEPAYLRGAAFETYTGHTWTQQQTDVTPVSPGTHLPSGYSSDVLTRKMTVQIRAAGHLGNSLFHLLEPVRVEGINQSLRTDENGNLWVGGPPPGDVPYQVVSHVPVYSAQHLRSLGAPAISPSMAPYLQLPASLPERIGELTRQITADQESLFDKARAVETYLRSFTYELEVPTTPKDRDFVDFFLFDLREGYCVYSATSMAVMLRTIGIPSRLVEGFAVPPSALSSVDEAGHPTYAALNSHAHAWVEAYFPGYGWVTFDPTPRSDLPQIDRAGVPPIETGSSEVDPSEPPSEAPPAAQETDDGTHPSTAADDPSLDGVNPMRLPWIAGTAAAGLLAFVGYRRWRLRGQSQTADPRLAVQEVWLRVSGLMGRFGLHRKSHQTVGTYARQLGATWPRVQRQAQTAAEDYANARYGPPDALVDEEAPLRAASFWRGILQSVKSHFGRTRYLWKRLFGPRIETHQDQDR